MKSGVVLGSAGLIGAAFGLAWAVVPSLSVDDDDIAETRAIEDSAVHYAGCDEVRLLGKAPLYSDQLGYSIDMDGDGDGIACEPHRY